MGTWATVEASNISEALRWDAEFFVNPYNEFLENIFAKRRDWVSLSAACKKLTSGHTPLHHDVSEGDTPFITVECVDPLTLNLQKAKRIWAYRARGELARVCVTRGDVLVTIKRRIAISVPIMTDPGLMAVNQDVVVMTPRREFRPGFVAAVLNSRIGQFQALRNATEQMNPYINVTTLGQLLIPLVSDRVQEEIEKVVVERLKLVEQSVNDYRLAEAELLDRLGWEEMRRKPVELSYVRDFADLTAAARADAEHFQPRYSRIEARLHERGCKPLGELIQPVINGFDCRDWSETGTPYIRVGDVARCEISSECQRVRPLPDEISKAVDIRPGDVLFTRKGTFGRAAAVKPQHGGWIISSEIMRLRMLPSAPISPGYLALFFCSPLGLALTEKFVHGVSNFSISQDDMRKLLIYIPHQKNGAADLEWQKRLAAKVEAAAQAKAAARAKLEEAKRLVEEAIKASSII